MTLFDRKTRFTLVKKIEHPRSERVHRSTLKAFRYKKINSLANDNGLEFTAHEKTSARLKIRIYFTRPYASWERGTVENTTN